MNWWNKNKLSGNTTENIVEYLINSMPDWKCCKFGVETHIKDIIDMIKGKEEPIHIKIKIMPDFVAFNEKTGETFFVEVKFRKINIFKYLENYNKYWEGTKLIIVRPNKPYFVYVNLKNINNSMREYKEFNGKMQPFWDFKENGQDIKDLFPDLKDKDIQESIGI